MKIIRILLFLILVLLSFSISAITTSRSLAFSDCYLLRAIGSDALYWNPANLTTQHGSFDIPIVNFKFNIENNGLNIHTYNKVTGQFLDDALKDDVLSGFKGHLGFQGSMHSTILGMTLGRIGLGIGVNAVGSGKLSKQYMNLLLYGNSEQDEIVFTKHHNDAEGIAYSDITIGAGDYEISRLVPIYVEKELPPIKIGFSVSALTGLMGFEVSSFNGHFSATDDGINLVQDVTVNEGTFGYGYKGMIGLKSEPINHLEVGLTFDNILGNITWSGSNKKHFAHVEVDSLYISDLNSDIFNPTDSTADMGSFTTILPAEMNIGVLYRFPVASFSVDWRQGFQNSFITSKQPRIAFGAEYLPTKMVPIQFGYSLPNQLEPYRFSYGLGLRFTHFEVGFAVQSCHALVPCNLSRGFTFALHSRVLY